MERLKTCVCAVIVVEVIGMNVMVRLVSSVLLPRLVLLDSMGKISVITWYDSSSCCHSG